MSNMSRTLIALRLKIPIGRQSFVLLSIVAGKVQNSPLNMCVCWWRRCYIINLFVFFACSTRCKMSDCPADTNNNDYQDEEQANRSDCRADENLLREVSTLSASTRRSTVTEESRETKEFRAAEELLKLSYVNAFSGISLSLSILYLFSLYL